jgi:hypothetical protein
MVGRIECRVQRLHDSPHYLITLRVGLDVGPRRDEFDSFITAFPQAHAVVDDFGNLVLVRGWL